MFGVWLLGFSITSEACSVFVIGISLAYRTAEKVEFITILKIDLIHDNFSCKLQSTGI